MRVGVLYTVKCENLYDPTPATVKLTWWIWLYWHYKTLSTHLSYTAAAHPKNYSAAAGLVKEKSHGWIQTSDHSTKEITISIFLFFLNKEIAKEALHNARKSTHPHTKTHARRDGERTLTKRFQMAFRNFEKLARGSEGAWCLIIMCRAKLKA